MAPPRTRRRRRSPIPRYLAPGLDLGGRNGFTVGMSANHPRLGYCCKFIPPGNESGMVKAMNTGTATATYLHRIGPGAALDKLAAVVGHNITALRRQVGHVAGLPAIERLLRLPSDLLPCYTHPWVAPIYADPDMRRLVETGLAALGAAAREGDVRLSMHPDQFCVISSVNERAWVNGVAEFEYHASVMAMMGYHGSWHPHGAHLNIHGGGAAMGVDGFRAGLARLSAQARNLVTVENDESSYGLDALLALADALPIVFDIHHHWVHSSGEYLHPGDARVRRIVESWRGVRPLAHVSVSREEFLLPWHPVDRLPDFQGLIGRGLKRGDLRKHSDMMWNDALNDLVAAHMEWADFEVEAKSKNLASGPLARHVEAHRGERALAA